MARYGIVVHGGVGSPGEFSDRCDEACRRGRALLESGMPTLDAVVEAVRILEDDGRFNAGSGSVLRLDGRTRETDAAVSERKWLLPHASAENDPTRQVFDPEGRLVGDVLFSATPHLSFLRISFQLFTS